MLVPEGVIVSPERDPEPVTSRLPRDIYVHYVRTTPRGGMCQLKAEAVPPLTYYWFRAGTPYTLKGVVGCSPPRSHKFDLRVQIDIDGWETHIVNGRDLL